MNFERMWVLSLVWLVPLVGALALYLKRRGERRLTRHMEPELLARLAPRRSRLLFAAQLGLALTGLLLMLVAVARPQWGTREERVYHRGRDLVILLDVSRSMLARDVHPDRLTRAKADLLDLIREIKGDRVALIAFRGRANLLCPLTTDHAYLKLALDGVATDSAPRGPTNIGEAINKALETFESDTGSHKAVILISDGEDLAQSALEAAAKAGERGIPIFAVGLGDPQGAAIPSEDKRGEFVMYEGKEVRSHLDHQTLSAIARKTGGAYLPVGKASLNENTLGTIYRQHMSRVAGQDLEESVQRRRIERFQVFLLPGVLALLGAIFLSRGRLALRAKAAATRTVPPPLKALGVALLLLGAPPAARAATNAPAVPAAPGPSARGAVAAEKKPAAPPLDVPPGREGARLAQRLYRLGRYERAAEVYRRAAEGATRASQGDFLYNAAVALYHAGKYEEAAAALDDVRARRGADDFPVEYNLGVTRYRASQAAAPSATNTVADIRKADLLRQAGESFQRAARLDSEDARAARNLALVEKTLPDAEDRARLARLLAKYQNAQPFQLADEMLQGQRRVLEQMPGAFTNGTPQRIALFEKLAADERALADLALPLKVKLQSAMVQDGKTPEKKDLEKVDLYVDETRERMRGAASSLRDLNVQAYEPGARAESEIYGMWKSMAPYDALLREDMYRQTNVIQSTESLQGKATDKARDVIAAQQDEAGGLTGMFLDRFQEAFPEGAEAAAPAPQATAPTNATPPSLSAEDRLKIIQLAQQATNLQKDASALLSKDDFPSALPPQRQAYAILKEIEALLPRQPNQQQQQQDQQQQNQQQDQQQQSKEEQKPQEKDQSQSPQNDQPEEQKPPESQPPEKADQKEDEKMNLEQAQRLLDKALQREKEYQDEKRRRQYLEMAPVDRDW